MAVVKRMEFVNIQLRRKTVGVDFGVHGATALAPFNAVVLGTGIPAVPLKYIGITNPLHHCIGFHQFGFHGTGQMRAHATAVGQPVTTEHGAGVVQATLQQPAYFVIRRRRRGLHTFLDSGCPGLRVHGISQVIRCFRCVRCRQCNQRSLRFRQFRLLNSYSCRGCLCHWHSRAGWPFSMRRSILTYTVRIVFSANRRFDGLTRVNSSAGVYTLR